MPKGSWRSRMSKRERSSNFCETGSRLNGWPRRSEFRLALLVPMSGPAGIWGPSCIASAQTALEELNRSDGIAHLEVIPVAIDAAHESMDSLASLVDDMIADGEIDAIVGMHLSSVRQKLAKIIGCRVPYIYTPLYEGGERSPGVFAIGETPERQLAPALQVLSNSRKLRRWALIGNDYVWPRVSHHIAKKCLRELSAEVVMEQYVPLGHENMASLIEELSASNADSVVISLVGQELRPLQPRVWRSRARPDDCEVVLRHRGERPTGDRPCQYKTALLVVILLCRPQHASKSGFQGTLLSIARVARADAEHDRAIGLRRRTVSIEAIARQSRPGLARQHGNGRGSPRS